MENNFQGFSRKNQKGQELETIFEDIEAVMKRIKVVKNQFDFETEPDLIESIIFEMKSLEIKYGYLIKKMNQLENTGEIIAAANSLHEIIEM